MKAHHFDKETGKWGVCNAQPGNCPKSPANRHFNSYGQMNQYSDGYFNPSIANKELLKEESTELLYGRADGLTDEIAELKTQLADKYTDESSFINELSESTRKRINENAETYAKNTIAGMNQFLEDEGIIPAYLTNKDGDLYYNRESLDSYICRGMNAIDNNGNVVDEQLKEAIDSLKVIEDSDKVYPKIYKTDVVSVCEAFLSDKYLKDRSDNERQMLVSTFRSTLDEVEMSRINIENHNEETHRVNSLVQDVKSIGEEINSGDFDVNSTKANRIKNENVSRLNQTLLLVENYNKAIQERGPKYIEAQKIIGDLEAKERQLKIVEKELQSRENLNRGEV